MNLKQRFKNKTFIVAMGMLLINFVYQLLAILGVAAPINENEISELLMLVSNILVGLGILVDPSTPGIKDQKVETENL